MYKFLCGHMSSFLLGILWRVKLLGQVVTMFNLLSNCQTIFQNGCAILLSHQLSRKAPISPHPSQHFVHLSDWTHPSQCEVIAHCGLWFTFCIWIMMQGIFSHTYWHLYVAVEELFIQILYSLWWLFYVWAWLGHGFQIFSQILFRMFLWGGYSDEIDF